MALKIVKQDDPITVESIVVVLYASPGIGKTTLAFSTRAPLMIDFDRGAYRAANRKDSVQVDSWEDITSMAEEDLKPYKTIIIDTAGRALDYLTQSIIHNNPKMGQRDGALTLKGYGALKSTFSGWLKQLRLFGKDVVLIAHSSEDKNGDDLIERLDIQGGSKGEIYKSADAMGRLYIVNGKRMLNFSPTDTAFGKNPAGLSPLTVPDIATDPTFFGDVIDSIKEKLNALTEYQRKRQAAIADWLIVFDDAQATTDYDALIKNIQQADQEIVPTLKGELFNRIKAAGFSYDAKTKRVVEAAA